MPFVLQLFNLRLLTYLNMILSTPDSKRKQTTFSCKIEYFVAAAAAILRREIWTHVIFVAVVRKLTALAAKPLFLSLERGIWLAVYIFIYIIYIYCLASSSFSFLDSCKIALQWYRDLSPVWIIRLSQGHMHTTDNSHTLLQAVWQLCILRRGKEYGSNENHLLCRRFRGDTFLRITHTKFVCI